MDERQDSKIMALRRHGSLNPRAGGVHDPLFQDSEFFDPRDLVLVKYEMLRRVRVEGSSVTAAANAFGFSRVAFYQAMAAFQEEGLPGLLPRRRGPKEAHKLTAEVLAFIDQLQAADSTRRPPQLAAMVLERLGLSVHPRSIERALVRRAKGAADRIVVAPGSCWTARYEDLRRAAMKETSPDSGSWGMALLMHHGLAAWMHAWPEEPHDNPAPAKPSPPPVELPRSAFDPLVVILANMVFTARQEVLT